MASGFGTFRSDGYVTSGSGRLLTTGVISQTVNTTNRTVTIALITLLTYYRTGSSAWKPGTGESITRWNTSSYVRSTIVGRGSTDGSTAGHNNYEVGFKGLNSGTVYTGQYTTVGDGVFTNYWVAQSSRTETYSYNDNGDAITISWEAVISLNGTVCSTNVNGGYRTVTTDSIAPLYKCHLYGPVNGRAREIGKLYGSVNGVAKKITKLYAGDENGTARLIYKG